MKINHSNWSKLRKISFILDNPSRKRILEFLIEKGETNVMTIQFKFRQEQSSISQHLAKLRSIGVVYHKKDGKYVFYSVNTDRLKKYSVLINKIASL